MKVMQNSNFGPDTAKRLERVRSYVYRPDSDMDWTYSHHGFLTFFKGRFYAMWSSGKTHEDYPGQRVMFSSSPNGINWDEPKALMDRAKGDDMALVLTAGGFYVHNGVLNSYVGQFEYTMDTMLPYTHAVHFRPANYTKRIFPKQRTKNTRLLVLSSKDGVNFSEPVDTGMPLVNNHPPQELASGRLLISGSVIFPYTDDPYGIKGWQRGGIYPKDMAEPLHDDREGLEDIVAINQWPSHRCEGSFVQMEDGKIRMLLRGGYENGRSVLYCAESTDNGQTWCEPYATDFTNDTSKFHFGKLPDGRYYYVGNPFFCGKRCPLVLSLSEDGYAFDKHYIIEDEPLPMRFEGMFKHGIYGYPHTLLIGDTMYVIYSINKEDIAVSAFSLSQL